MDPIFGYPSLLADFLPAFLESSEIAGAFPWWESPSRDVSLPFGPFGAFGLSVSAVGTGSGTFETFSLGCLGQILGEGDGNQELPGKKTS